MHARRGLVRVAGEDSEELDRVQNFLDPEEEFEGAVVRPCFTAQTRDGAYSSVEMSMPHPRVSVPSGRFRWGGPFAQICPITRNLDFSRPVH